MNFALYMGYTLTAAGVYCYFRGSTDAGNFAITAAQIWLAANWVKNGKG